MPPPAILTLAPLSISVLSLAGAQTPWPPPSLSPVDPTAAAASVSRPFLTDEQHQLLTSPSFGQRLTTRPRPATRRDWTPIWPGGQTEGGGGGTTAVRTGRPSQRPEPVTPPSLAPSRPPVTEYYFASSSVTPADTGSGAGPSFPPAQLPTATFAAPAATPTRALPTPSTRRSATQLDLPQLHTYHSNFSQLPRLSLST